jgi:hypothetical protein
METNKGYFVFLIMGTIGLENANYSVGFCRGYQNSSLWNSFFLVVADEKLKEKLMVCSKELIVNLDNLSFIIQNQ